MSGLHERVFVPRPDITAIRLSRGRTGERLIRGGVGVVASVAGPVWFCWWIGLGVSTLVLAAIALSLLPLWVFYDDLRPHFYFELTTESGRRRMVVAEPVDRLKLAMFVSAVCAQLQYEITVSAYPFADRERPDHESSDGVSKRRFPAARVIRSGEPSSTSRTWSSRLPLLDRIAFRISTVKLRWNRSARYAEVLDIAELPAPTVDFRMRLEERALASSAHQRVAPPPERSTPEPYVAAPDDPHDHSSVSNRPGGGDDSPTPPSPTATNRSAPPIGPPGGR